MTVRSRCISGANRLQGLAITPTVEIHLRCLRNGIVNCDAVLLSRPNTVACVAITRFARLVQHQERCTGLSVS